MKKQLFMYAGVLLVFTQACNNGEKKADEPVAVTDTIVKTEIVTVPVDVDTAAIIAFYASEHSKAKGSSHAESKPKGNKKVSIDSDPIFTTPEVLAPPPPENKTGDSKKPAVNTVQDNQSYYFITNDKANFPGGEKAFDKYLLYNLEYPEKALEAGQSRTVYPTLFLDEAGKPIKVEFRYEPTIYGFQDEVRRILMKSPNWNPAKVDGKAVKSKFTLPVTFKIED